MKSEKVEEKVVQNMQFKQEKYVFERNTFVKI